MTDDKTRQTTAPGNDDTQLEGQTVLEGFQAEDTEERVSVTMDRFVAAIHDYREFIVQRDKSIEENETILCSDEPLDKDTAQVAYYMKELSEVMREQLNPEAWMEATRQVASRLESMQRDLANGFNLIAEMMKDKDYPPPANIEQSLKKLMDSKGGILESLDTFISRFKGYSPDDITRIVSDIGTRVMERLSQLSPEELAELERELDAEEEGTAPGTSVIDSIVNESFTAVLQNSSTSKLTKFSPKKVEIDPITGDATFSRGNFQLTISNYHGELSAQTWKLLLMFFVKLTRDSRKSPTQSVTLEEYMALRKLKSRQKSKQRVIKDMDTIKKMSFTLEEIRTGKNGKREISSYKFVNVADSGEVAKNGTATLTLGASIHKSLINGQIMNYPPAFLALKDDDSFFIGTKIAELKNMNVLKPGNGDIISVKTLLDVAAGIPSYEEVARTDRAYTRRIIQRFEDCMNELEATGVFTWEYCHSKGAPLAEEELHNFTYEVFSACYVKITWADYPDQTARRERQQARIEEAKAKKKRGRKPKKPPAE